jgi:hypothetical protein
MKGTFFNKPLEWSVETKGEAWTQDSAVSGFLRIKNHGQETVSLSQLGVGLAYAEIKKVHARTEGILKPSIEVSLPDNQVSAGDSIEIPFSLKLPSNCPVSDKKSSYFLTYGSSSTNGNLQLNVAPLPLFEKIIGLMDTFYRFKVKDFKTAKLGVEFRLIPPTSREMANIDSLNLTFSMKEEILHLNFEFQIKKLDTTSVTTKINKESVKHIKELGPKEYLLGRDMINQDQLLKNLESVISEIKVKNAF